MNLRSYDAERDSGELWALKRRFELELGAGKDGAATEAYAGKVTERYRERYLDWVDRCVAESAETVTVAAGPEELVGYAFLLPESLAMIWDAAVLNELYVDPDYRGSGLADELLERAVATARTQSLPMDRLVLDVAPTNERAFAFYDRHGFEPWGEMVARPL